MIGNLARKRTNLAALAVLAALIGAMLVALPPSSAQASGITLGGCTEWDPDDPVTNYIAIGDHCTFDDLDDAESAVSSNPAVVASHVEVDGNSVDEQLRALSVGTAHVVLTDGTAYRITVIGAPSLIVRIADSDNIVSNQAPPPAISVIARGFAANQVATDTNITVSVNGIFFQRTGNVTSFVSGVETGVGSALSGFTYAVSDRLNIAGAATGKYKITASIPAASAAVLPETAARKIRTGSADLMIGDPGTSPSSATLSLGLVETDNPTTVADESVPERGSKPSSATINVVYSISNSLGNIANPSDLRTVQVIAPQGVVTPNEGTVTGTTRAETSVGEDDGVVLTPRGSLNIGSAGNLARTVSVRVIVTGAGGVAETNVLTLTFTGGAGSIALSDASGTLLNTMQANDSRDQITFGFSAMDSAGNTVDNPKNLSYVITGPDGAPVNVNRISRVQADAPGSRAGTNNLIELRSLGSSASTLATGEYTLKVNSGALTTSASFIVAAKAASVDVSVDNANPSNFAELIEVTATVSDTDGNPAADGTSVTFPAPSSGQDTVLSRVGVTGAIATRGGEAKATFAVVGSGRAVITATADGATGVAVIISTAGGAGGADSEAMMAGTECLTNLAAFTSWQCAEGVNVSEIFAELSGRGATAIHLWNTTRWVRYAVVDGVEIVGSNDFLIKQGDTLYISN